MQPVVASIFQHRIIYFMEDDYKKLVSELQALRKGVRTFIFLDDIGIRSVLRTRAALKDVSTGDEIDIILNSPGGQPADAYRLIRSFRERYKKVNIIIPFWAKSAATLFAFGGTTIVMHEFGELGPIDAQIRKNDEEKPSEAWESALNVQSSLSQIEDKASQSFVNLLINLQLNPDINIGRKQLADMLLKYNASFYTPLLEKIDTYEMGEMARYLDIGKMYAKRILKQYGIADDEKVTALLDFLVYDCPDHGYVVDYAILSKYLPNVIKSTDKPFGAAYDKTLGDLSRLLMFQREEVLVGFIDVLNPQPTDIISEGGQNANTTTKKKSGIERPGGKSTENGNQKKPKKND